MTRAGRIFTIIAAICFVLLAAAVLFAWKSPSTGYEASIYQATPHLFWVFLLLALIGGISIVVHQVYTQGYQRHHLWMVGLLLIILSNGLMLALPAIRGYALYGRGDPSSHLGWIQDIILTGHFDRDLFYPVLHTYTAAFSSISGIDPVWLHKYLPAYFGMLYIPFMYLFASSILSHKGQLILATLAAATFQVPVAYFTPDNLSTLFLPLALFTLVRSSIGAKSKAQYSLLFVIMLLLFAPFHPVSAGVLLLITLTLWIPRRLLAFRSHFTGESSFRFNSTVTILMFVWITTWISSFYIWGSTIRNIHRVITEGGTIYLEVLLGQIEYASRYGYSVVEQFFKAYGGTLLYVLLALISLPVLRKKLANKPGNMPLVSLYAPLGALAIAILLLYFLRLGFGPGRLVKYGVMLCTPFVGFILYELLVKARQYLPKLCLIAVITIITLTSVFGGLYMYRSPYRLAPNDQTTYQRIEGTDWFLKHKDRDATTSGFGRFRPYRYAAFLLTPRERVERKDIPYWVEPPIMPAYHFGYDTHQTLGESYPEDAYLAITQLDKAIYSEVYSKMASIRFEPQDFERLNYDHSLDKLYSNGEFEIWWVRAAGSSP